MENQTHGDDVYQVEPPMHRRYSLERGGRLGITISSGEQAENSRESLTALVTALLVAVAGFGVIGYPVGSAVGAIALFMAGVAFERVRYMRQSDVN